MANGDTVRRWREQEAAGMTRTEIARRAGVTRQAVTKALGPAAARGIPGNPRPQRKIFVYDEPYRQARQIARDLGYVLESGSNAGKDGSVSLLIEAIGRGEVTAQRVDR